MKPPAKQIQDALERVSVTNREILLLDLGEALYNYLEVLREIDLELEEV